MKLWYDPNHKRWKNPFQKFSRLSVTVITDTVGSCVCNLENDNSLFFFFKQLTKTLFEMTPK